MSAQPSPAPGDRGLRLPWLIALAAMAGLVAGLPAFLGRTVVDAPEVLDLGNQWFGFAAFVRHTYLEGHFPLWDPHDLCGMPFLAFAHTGSLYAPWVMAHLATASYPLAGALDIFFHLAAAALMAFIFFQQAGRSRPTAFLAAAAYAFSGFIFANINLPPSLHTGAWLPLWYAAAFSLLDRPRRGVALLAALALAAMIFGGDLEMVVYGGLGLLFELVLRRREARLRREGLFALGASLAIGALLAWPQLLPALEFNHLSVRSGETFIPEVGNALIALIPVYALFQIPIPAVLYPANRGLDHWYLGAFFILLAAAALARPGSARRRLLIFPAAAIYALIFYFPPLNTIACRIPVLGSLIVPLRMWPVLELFFLVAATQTLDDWIRQGAKAPRAFLPGGGAGAAYFMGFGLATLGSLYWIGHGRGTRALFSLGLAALGALALIKPGSLRSITARGRTALALALALGDLYLLALAWMPMTDPQRLLPDPRLSAFLADTSGQARYQILSIRGIIDPRLPYHLGLRLHADTVDTFSRLPPRAAALRLARLYPALFRRDEKGRLIQFDQMAVRDPRNLDPGEGDLINQMNVKWIVSRFPWSARPAALALSPELDQPDLQIYQNTGVQPRARIAGRGGSVAVPVRYPASDQVTLDLDAVKSPALAAGETVRMVLADSWYPGWRAWAGNREVRIQPDRLDFRGLETALGGTVNFSYQPASFRIGLFAGIASLLVLVLMGWGRVRPKVSG